MKRQLITIAIIGFNLLLAGLFLQIPLAAAPAAQQETAANAAPTRLVQPLHLTIYQQLPVSVTLGTAALSRTVTMTFEVGLNLVVTQSMTSTVASSVTLQLSNNQTVTLPISFTLRQQPAATVVVSPLQTAITTTEITSTEKSLPTPTATHTATPTATATHTPTPSPTVLVTPTATGIESTVNITANLRAGPSTTFDIVGQASPGQRVTVAGISTDGLFFLLNNGQWIAVGLLNNVPTNPPLATDELIASLRTPTPTTGTQRETPTPTPTQTPAATRSLLPTPTPTAEAERPTALNNANLRAGPGLEFATIGGTVAGQALTIAGRNQDGTWFQLDNGGWMAAFLVANPPSLADVPVVNPSQTTNNTTSNTGTNNTGTSNPITTTTGLTSTTTLTTTTAVTP